MVIRMRNFIKKHPNTAYYLMAFGWTWILVFGLILSGGVKDISQPSKAFIIVGLLCNVAPSIAAFIVTRIAKGKEGVSELKGRLKKKSPSWVYVLTFLVVPSVTLLTTVISQITIRRYEFSLVIPMIVMGLIWPLFSGFGEEFGWRSYILPQLLAKYSPLKAGILLGVIWECWHLPMHYIGWKDYGVYMIPAFLVIGFINLTLQTLIMTQIFVKSGGNLKLLILYHYTITASSIILGGFLKAESLPKYALMEGLISVTLFLMITIVLYARKSANGSTAE